MEIIQAIILGITQGLTEFIPVSSSGHLILVGHLIGFKDSSLVFDAATNIGTLTALLIFFRRDFIEMVQSLFKNNEKTRLAWLLVIATIPAVIAGVLLQSKVETVFRSDHLVAVNLLVVGVLLIMADHFSKPRRELKDMKPKHAFSIGLSQALAIIPGVSRSGITITTGLFEGFDRVSATRFSFLLSAPIIAGATAKVLIGDTAMSQMSANLGIFVVAILASLVSGYWAIRFMLDYLQKHGLKWFGYYRITVGLLVLAIWAVGVK